MMIKPKYTLQIGYKSFFGKTIFFDLLSTDDSLIIIVILEKIWGATYIAFDFLPKAIHTIQKPCTIILGKRWRMRILKR